MIDPTLPAWALLSTHLLFSLILVLRLLFGHTGMRLVHLSWALALPVFGPLAGLCMASRSAFDQSELSGLLAKMNANEEKHIKLIRSQENYQDTVPLEEALLINDSSKRRTLMLSVLQEDSTRYLDLLMVARLNEDGETAHYAAATIMQIQRDLQLSLQRYEVQAQEQNQSIEQQLSYIELLSKYIDSGLLEGQLLVRKRMALNDALNKVLQQMEDAELLAKLVRNYLALDLMQDARECSERLLANYPSDERAWLEALRVCAQTHDPQRLQRILKQMEGASIAWTTEGRETLKFWKGNRNEK
ncbi:MAG: hypothetical protein RR824_05650 [Clostridia bacterium]